MSVSLPSGTLIIAEKSSLGAAIAKAFDSPKTQSGYIAVEGGVRIGWARGHLFEHDDFDSYLPEDARGSWQKSRHLLPFTPPKLTRSFSGKQQKQAFEKLRDLMSDAKMIVHAGDPDREGQAIVDEILERANWRGPVKRLWTTALDPKSIRNALSSMRDNDEYQALRYAQKCRSEADFLIGMEFTRIYSVDGGQFYRIGRVKTPTLALVVWRDREIARFKPKDYWEPVLTPDYEGARFDIRFEVPGDSFPAKMDESHRLLDKTEAQGILDGGLGDPSNEVIESKFETKSQAAPLPFSTLHLQKAASARYGFTAQRTLDLVAELYRKGITTYPRVDCQYFPESFHETAAASMRPFAEELNLDLAQKHAAFDDKKIADHAHYAIGLTGETGSMNEDERKIYLLIRDSIAALFAKPWRYRKGVLRVRSGSWSEQSLVWKATGRATIDPGWKTILAGADPDEEDDMSLPEVPVGTTLTIEDGRLVGKKTTPPSAYTDSTLVTAMDNIHRVIDDPRAKAVLKEASGIGTNATRSTIIEELIQGDLLTRRKKSLIATANGHALIDALESVGSPIADPVLTASWEEKLAGIAKDSSAEGARAYKRFLDEITQAMKDWASAKIVASGGETCPDCGKDACKRFKSRKTGFVFWRCQECKSAFVDEKGKLGKKMEGTQRQEGEACPKCAETAVVRRESQKKPGVFFWRCTACKKNFADDEGSIGRCFDDKPPQEKGEPCPKCSKEAVVRRESRNKPGVFYFRCTACGTPFADDDGTIGKEFGTKGGSGKGKAEKGGAGKGGRRRS